MDLISFGRMFGAMGWAVAAISVLISTIELDYPGFALSACLMLVNACVLHISYKLFG